MAAWHYDLFLVATGPIDAGALTQRLTAEFPVLASPSPKLLLWGSLDGDRVDFWVEHVPLQLLARFDLRSPSDEFRRSILKLADELSLRLVNSDDVEVAATDGALVTELESSSAAEFVRHPPAVDEDDDDS
jgi:hypothetical protein